MAPLRVSVPSMELSLCILVEISDTAEARPRTVCSPRSRGDRDRCPPPEPLHRWHRVVAVQLPNRAKGHSDAFRCHRRNLGLASELDDLPECFTIGKTIESDVDVVEQDVV